MKRVKMVLANKSMGVSAISLVDSPAIEEGFVKLREDQKELKLSFDSDKQIVTGPVMIPGQEIYRNSSFYLGECMIFFDAETIKAASELYLSSNKSAVTLQHKDDTNKVKICESWIIEDTEKDKSKMYGFELPVGTWMASHHVEDLEIWEKIKSGEMNGYSIESIFEGIELAKEEKCMTDDEIDNMATEIVAEINNQNYK